MKKTLVFLMLAIFAFTTVFVTGCGKDDNSDVVECTNITFKASGYDEGAILYLNRGETVTIQGTVLPNNATNKVIEWSTNNADISVESTGDSRAKITAYDVGQAKITAKCGNFTKSIDVECVTEVQPTALYVDSEVMTIPVTQRAKIGYTFEPMNTSNKNISCLVTAIGEANSDYITVVEENGEYYISISQLAAVGDKYLVNLRSVAVSSIKASIEVTVGALDVQSMSFKSEEITLSVNDPLYRLVPLFEPKETSYTNVTFTSSNPEICDVNEIGTLQPKQAGTATISAINEYNNEITCSTTVTVTLDESDYLIRLLKKSDIDALTAVSYDKMDFETDKVAFKAWQKVLSEDCNASSHISDAGWAIWMAAFDTYDDDNSLNAGDANAMVYCKITVPQTATKMQYVFRAHPFPDDNAKFKILAITKDYEILDCTSGWVVMSNTADMFYDVDVSEFAGEDVTFVVMQDQIGNKSAGNYMKVSLMFRRCLFNVASTNDVWIIDEAYSIVQQQK